MAELIPGVWNLDASHSEIGFSVRHAGVSKSKGVFNDAEATFTATENIAESRISASVKIDSIDTRSADRDNHLKSAEFFDADTYPVMTFTSSSVDIDGEDLAITGDLTIKGQTRPVEFKGEFGGVVTDVFGTTRFGASVSTQISRKDFGITWNAAIEAGGVMVGDKVTITLDVEFVAPTA